ncbi:MAG: Hsp20 family protein [Rhodobacteraceae bacterium]|nr:Hsp20 family protein [Paracoccaceae bacterium]
MTQTQQLYTHNAGLFDLFFKDFFNDEHFQPLEKIHYPVDIYELPGDLCFDIVAIGAQLCDVEITTEEGDVLKVQYESSAPKTDIKKWHSRNISKKNFNFGWKIPARFDLANISAIFEGGVIKLRVPIKEDAKPKKIKLG